MRVGIVGLGFRLGYLARAFSLATEQFEVVGYVEPAPAGLPYTRKHGVAVGRQYASLEQMLDEAGLDLLMVGSPNHMHLGHIRAGLARGLKVFLVLLVVFCVAEFLVLALLLGL